MNEELNTEVLQDQQVQPPIQQPVQQLAPQKMLTQEQFNAAAGKIRAEAEERTRRKIAQEGGMGGMQQLGQQDIEAMINERIQSGFAQQQQAHQAAMHEQHANNIANDFIGKIEQGKISDADHEGTFKDVDYREIADLVPLIGATENTYLVTKELLNNPEKVATIRGLLKDSPRLAAKAVSNLSNSIKANTQALAQQKTVNDPLGQLLPSSIGTSDNGPKSVTDWRKYWAKNS